MRSPAVKWPGDMDLVPHHGIFMMAWAPAPKYDGMLPAVAPTPDATLDHGQLSVKTTPEPSGMVVWQPMHSTCPFTKPGSMGVV